MVGTSPNIFIRSDGPDHVIQQKRQNVAEIFVSQWKIGMNLFIKSLTCTFTLKLHKFAFQSDS